MRKKSLFPYFGVFEKLCHPVKRGERIGNAVQHHRYDRRVSKQLYYRLVKRFLSDLRAHCLILLLLFHFLLFFFHRPIYSELCQSTCFENEKQTKEEMKEKHILNSREDKEHRYRPVYIINSSSTIIKNMHHNLCILVELSFYTICSANRRRASSIHCIKRYDKAQQMQ